MLARGLRPDDKALSMPCILARNVQNRHLEQVEFGHTDPAFCRAWSRPSLDTTVNVLDGRRKGIKSREGDFLYLLELCGALRVLDV